MNGYSINAMLGVFCTLVEFSHKHHQQFSFGFMWFYLQQQWTGKTNNIREGFNNKLKNVVRIQHPYNSIFIESNYRSNSLAMIKLLVIYI